MLKLKSLAQLAQNCCIVIGIVLLSLLLMLGLDPWLGMTETPFLLFFGAVPIAALCSGRLGGLTATVLCALLASYFFIPPIYSFSLDFIGAGRVLIFLLECILISILIGDLRFAQRQTQKSLRQLESSEAKFRRLVDSNILGVVSANIHGAITDANDAFLHSLGYTREDLLAGRLRWDTMTPDDLKHLDVPAYTELITTGKNTPYEKVYIGKQGQRVPIVVGAALLEDDPEQIISFILDISERKQSEAEREQLLQQLASERVLFEAVLSQMPEGVMIADAASGQLVLANQRTNQILQHNYDLNLELEQYELNVPFQAYHPDGRVYAAHEYPLMRSLQTGEVVSHEELEIRYSDGHRIFIDTSSAPILNPEGQIISAVVVFQDITQRKQTEASLRQSDERLRVALKNAPIAVFNQNQALQYTWIYNATFNYQMDQVLGKQDSDFVRPEEAAILNQIKRRVIETGIGTREEVKLTQTEREYYYDLTVEPLKDTNGDIIGVTCAAIDISELKQTELALRQSEERFRLLAEQVQVIPWEADAVTGRFTYVGPQAVEILGYPIETWYTDNFWAEQIYAPDREWALKFCQESSLSLDNYDFEYRMLTVEGRIVWLYDVVNVVRHENQPQLLRGIMIDITQRKQQEEAQQYLAEVSKVLASSLDYQTTLNQLAQQMVPHLADWCAVQVLESDGSIQPVATAHVNPAKIQWAEELRRRYPLHPDDPRGTPRVLRTGQPEFYPNISDALLAESARDPEHLRLLREVGFRSAMIVPMQSHGKTLGTLTLVAAESGRSYDQTDLALAEELARRAAFAVDNAQLYQQAQQTQQIAERFANRMAILQRITAAFSKALTSQQIADVVMQQGIAATGASAGSIALLTEPGTTLKILQAVGYPESMLNQWSSFPLHAAAPLAETARTGVPLFLETAAAMLDKYPVLADSIAATGHQAFACLPLTVEDRLIGVMGLSFANPQTFDQEDRSFMLTLAQQSAQAIARAHLYEAEQTARSEAEAANRVKDEFLAVLSHELRTPLNPILGWSRLLQTQKLDPTKTAYALATIERNAKLQVELIEDLLDVSRILRGKLVLNIAPVHLATIIEAAKETVQLAAESKGIQIQTVLATAIGTVAGDPARLQQVVWNLLANAVKFTPAGGRVEVRLEQVESGAAAPWKTKAGEPQQSIHAPIEQLHAYAQITVTDTGKGISPEFLPRVFDYFRQEDGKTTRKFGGLGLGLAIVRHLVELHGGTIRAESPGEGMGATFTVKLPLQNRETEPVEALNQPLAPAPLPPLPLAGTSILVVDDDNDTRDFITFLLEQVGAKVIAVATASDALLALPQSQPDVLVSDIGMPDIDGYALMRQVRALPPEQGGTLPAIALTAYAGDFNQQQALQAGFQQHLAKPIEPATLVATISKLINRS